MVSGSHHIFLGFLCRWSRDGQQVQIKFSSMEDKVIHDPFLGGGYSPQTKFSMPYLLHERGRGYAMQKYAFHCLKVDCIIKHNGEPFSFLPLLYTFLLLCFWAIVCSLFIFGLMTGCYLNCLVSYKNQQITNFKSIKKCDNSIWPTKKILFPQNHPQNYIPRHK